MQLILTKHKPLGQTEAIYTNLNQFGQNNPFWQNRTNLAIYIPFFKTNLFWKNTTKLDKYNLIWQNSIFLAQETHLARYNPQPIWANTAH